MKDKTDPLRKEVVCALIIDRGKLLVTQHGMHSGHPWKWEFPGGKIQPGESRKEALVREIMEELEIAISVVRPLKSISHAYADKEIVLYPYLCHWEEGSMNLTEHHQALWIAPADTSGLDMLEADHKMLEEGDNLSLLIRFASTEKSG